MRLIDKIGQYREELKDCKDLVDVEALLTDVCGFRQFANDKDLLAWCNKKDLPEFTSLVQDILARRDELETIALDRQLQ